jgi:hypothetical protein
VGGNLHFSKSLSSNSIQPRYSAGFPFPLNKKPYTSCLNSNVNFCSGALCLSASITSILILYTHSSMTSDGGQGLLKYLGLR